MKNDESRKAMDELAASWQKQREKEAEERASGLQMKGEKVSEEKEGWGELDQSRGAVWSAVGIILVLGILSIVLSFVLTGETPSAEVFGINRSIMVAIVIDLFLAINLLRGKRWARTLTLVRAVLGLLVWGIILIIQKDFPGLVIQIGYCASILLLLTGTSTRYRVAGGVAVCVVSLMGGLIWAIMPTLYPHVPQLEEPSTVEVEIPAHFTTYTSEGLFSISYPPEWEPATSTMGEVFEATEKELRTLDTETAAAWEEVEILFLAGRPMEERYYPSVVVVVMPRPSGIWTLAAQVEAECQWAKENLQKYHEHSRFRMVVSGNDCIMVDEQDYTPEFGTWRFLKLYTVKSEWVWIVTCASELEDFKDYEETLNHTLRSIRILK